MESLLYCRIYFLMISKIAEINIKCCPCFKDCAEMPMDVGWLVSTVYGFFAITNILGVGN